MLSVVFAEKLKRDSGCLGRDQRDIHPQVPSPLGKRISPDERGASASAHDVFQSRKQTSNDVTLEGFSRGCGAFPAVHELASGLLSARATY